MELRRAADAVLRCQVSPLASFLAPSTTTRWVANTQLHFSRQGDARSRRALTTSSRKHAIRRPVVTTSAAPLREDYYEGSSEPKSDSLHDITESISWTARPSGSARKLPYGGSGLSPARERALNGGSSSRDILASLQLHKAGSSSKFEASRMLDPISMTPENSPSQTMMQDLNNSLSPSAMLPPRKRDSIKLNPSTGRTVAIGNGGIDLGRGLRLLEQSCARNKVKQNANSQRFHERAGLKRKRLRRVRWRMRFMEGFKATLHRVKQLKKQGW